jgi:hypothetical protein
MRKTMFVDWKSTAYKTSDLHKSNIVFPSVTWQKEKKGNTKQKCLSELISQFGTFSISFFRELVLRTCIQLKRSKSLHTELTIIQRLSLDAKNNKIKQRERRPSPQPRHPTSRLSLRKFLTAQRKMFRLHKSDSRPPTKNLQMPTGP